MAGVQDYLYKMQQQNVEQPKNTSSSSRQLVRKSYSDILQFVRTEISKNHAEDLREVIADPVAQNVLKNLITKYINENSFVCQDINDIHDLVEKIFQDMAGFGVLTKYIYDKDVEEINVNSWRDIEVLYPEEKGGLIKLDETFESPQQAVDIVQRMCACGGIRLDESQPVKDSYITKGIRCSAILSPIVDKEAGVAASIRRQKTVAITREELLNKNTALPEELDFLNMCVNCGVSVGYAGGTGSGKTTDMGVLLKNIPYDKRIYTIEDSRELDLIVVNEKGKVLNRVIHTVTRPHEDSKSNVEAVLLLKEALRQHPDIIVPAEMRGAEAMTAVNAGLTGHTIVTSVHANSALKAYNRILMLCQEQQTNLSETMLMEQIVEAFPIMVYKEQLNDGTRKIKTIIEGIGYSDGKVKYNVLYRFRKTGTSIDEYGRLKIEGYHEKVNNISDRLALRLFEKGAEEAIIRKYANENWTAEQAYERVGGDENVV